MACTMAEKPLTPAEIKRIREACKLTQAEAAARVGVSQGYWSSLEAGTYKPSLPVAKLIRMLANLR